MEVQQAVAAQLAGGEEQELIAGLASQMCCRS